ncbi:MAG: B12-binding domain-containing radical SAM protein [Deltaproteobacteria bacterium]|nr:B12-binding domain-containing radical SAM protein [Deltaproteobacteria bacterium]MCL5791518.1 B12-binding domain-containing radical SAM protein [Deltaproteobacteria bacterium]
MKKVLFIEPKAVEANVFAKFINLPLLGPLYLGTMIKQAGFDVKIINENLLGRKLTLNELEGDVLLLTSLTCTSERAYEIARQFKSKNPNSTVIMGGIHATFLQEEAGKYVDYVVAGEGENVIIDLLKHGSDKRIIQGEFLHKLDNIPVPDFDLLVNSKKLNITPVMTSRGCPYDCNFCSVTKMFGQGYRTFSVDRVIEELKNVKTEKVFFYDDNFTANINRTYELMERIAKENFKFRWSAQVRTDITRYPDLVNDMKRAGCDTVYVGFESISDKTLKDLSKHQTIEDIKRAIDTFHTNDIYVHGMFIFGSDEDEKNIFKETADFSIKNKVDTVQYAILTPLPGTETFEKLESQGRLLHKMWQYYDGLHAVFQPEQMSAIELQQGMLDAFEEFYSYTRIFNEALNASYDHSIGKIIGVIKKKVHTLDFKDVTIKVIANHIIKNWYRLNKDYLLYLSRVKASVKEATHNLLPSR